MSDHMLFAVSCYLKVDVPQHIIEVLEYMVDPTRREPPVPPDHPAFREEEIDGEVSRPWRSLFDTESNSFPGPFGAGLAPVHNIFRADGSPAYSDSLTFRCGVHEDDMAYYVDFLYWLAPYSDTKQRDGFVGYVQDTAYPDPRLLYFIDGHLRMGSAGDVWDGWRWWPET
jgi:hypothetical protein